MNGKSKESDVTRYSIPTSRATTHRIDFFEKSVVPSWALLVVGLTSRGPC